MWLLDTSTAELHHFNGVKDVKGGYAILSHVWQDDEQSFQDLQALASSPHSDRPLRARVSAKIRDCCVLAESHGYAWLWIDTCCIDRTSSAELSEAINSMFAWYARAQVCYAYLHDVPPGDPAHGTAFRRSRWFTRGWTLQELVAPRSVLFVARDWSALGTKGSLAPLLEAVTGVDADVLTFRRALGDVSVARRMAWAAPRRTTRVEDEAYCLMGLFGVHMPTIYGEGARAFLRLQEEILRRTSDQTLFAWGNVLPIRTVPFREDTSHSNYHQDSHIFAPSPAAFASSGNMVPVPMKVAVENAVKALGISRWALGPSQNSAVARRPEKTWKIPLPDFTATSHGVRARQLIIESSAGRTTLAIAVLACKDTATDSFVGLLLRRRADDDTGLEWPRYYVGTTVRGQRTWLRLRFRLAQVNWARHALSGSTSGITARWQRLYISHRPPSRPPPRPAHRPDPVFRLLFPRWLAVELAKDGWTPDAELPSARAAERKIEGRAAMETFSFTHACAREAFRIHVGLCGGSPWATATFSGDGVDPRARPPSPETFPIAAPQGHLPAPASALVPSQRRSGGCERDRGPDVISSWAHGSRIFGDSRRNVQLTFTRLNGGGSHLLDVHVGGSVYQKIKAPSLLGRASLHTQVARAVARLTLMHFAR
ncbi:heterokaryon incompatibility protein-domain-containing protein [Lenzites betulinus]|nr:heterokaryon incompatibility protein-domain-containing protein [Lenzites betulinus]